MLNETMNLNRSVEPTRIEPTRIEPPRPEPIIATPTIPESIIPKLPETPIKKTPKIVIKPSPKIETKEPPIIKEPPKEEIKPADVAPPKKTPPKFYKKLVDNTKDITSQLSNSILEDAIKEVNTENKAATLIGSALRGHKGRKTHSIIKKYPEVVNKRLEQVKEMDPKNLLQYKPKTDDKGKPLYLQKLEEKLAKEEKRRIKDKEKIEQTLLANPKIGDDLENKTFKLKNKSATAIQTAIRGKISRNKAADLYIQKKNRDQGINELLGNMIDQSITKAAENKISSAIKSRKARKDYKTAQEEYDPRMHQKNITEKRKEFTRIMTTKTTSKQAKQEAQKKFKKTNFLFKRKSNAGRPPNI